MHISNFNIVILADDGSLWALGMGEYDRNSNPEPLRVQTDFHSALDSNIHGSEEIVHRSAYGQVDEGSGKMCIMVPIVEGIEANTSTISNTEKTFLRKGHQRVSLIVPEFKSTENEDKTTTSDTVNYSYTAQYLNVGAYEVVVHEGEAYLIQLDLSISADRGAGKSDKPTQPLRVVDYSSGWKHSLLVVENA